MQCLCDQSLFMRHQDPDDLPFKAGEELMVVSKVRIVTLVTVLDYILSPTGRGAMVDGGKLPGSARSSSSALPQACPSQERPPPPPQEREPPPP